MRRPALVFGVDRIGKDDRFIRLQPIQKFLLFGDMVGLRRLVGARRQRFGLAIGKAGAE